MTGLSKIMVSSSDFVLEKGTKIKSGGASLPGLQQDRIIDAKVVDILSSRRVQLLISGQKVVARTHVPLKPGDQIQLKVMSADPQPILKLMVENRENRFHDLIGGLKQFGRSGAYDPLLKLFAASEMGDGTVFNSSEAVSHQPDVIRRFMDVIASMALKSDIPDPTLLKRIMAYSGLQTQALANASASSDTALKTDLPPGNHADLKAMALNALNTLNTDKAAEDDNVEILGRLRSFVQNLDQMQQLNQKSFDELGKMLLPLPLVWEHQLKFGQLLIDLGRHRAQKAPDERIISVSMLLGMTHLGDIRADFSMLGKAINGSFGVAGEELREFFLEHIPTLVDRLRANHFMVQKIECQVLKPETLASASLVDDIVSMDQDIINFLV